MNESNELIGKEPKTKTQILKKNLKLKVKINKSYITRKQVRNRYIAIGLGIFSFIFLCSIFYYKFNHKKTFQEKNLSIQKDNTTKSLSLIEQIYKSLDTYETIYNKRECNSLDPINIFKQRLNSNASILCENGNSKHICYKDDNPIFVAQNGASCEF